MGKGILFDTLFHPDFPKAERQVIVRLIRGTFSSDIGKQAMSKLDAIITPAVMDMGQIADEGANRALAVHEAQRSFWAQIKALVDYDDRSDPADPNPKHRTGRRSGQGG